MDRGGEVQSFGPWAISIHNGPLNFSEGVVRLDGVKGTVGGAALLGG